MNWAFLADLDAPPRRCWGLALSGDRADAGHTFVDFHSLALTDQDPDHASPEAARSRGEHKAGEDEELQAAAPDSPGSNWGTCSIQIARRLRHRCLWDGGYLGVCGGL